MRSILVLDTLEMALWLRRSDGIGDRTAWSTTPTPAASQYTSFAFTQRLIDAGVDPPAGSVGDAYNNALADSQIGLYKAQLIRAEGPWRNVEQIEAATLEWVDWINTQRPHKAIDDLTPVQAEQAHYAARNRLGATA